MTANSPRGPSGLGHYLPAFALAVVGMAGLAALLAMFLPGLLGSADEVDRIRHGAWLGVGLATLVGLATGARIVQLGRTGGGPLGVMAVGFLVKLVLLALGVVLLHGTLSTLGHPAAFGIAFASAVLFFQLLFLPIVDRVLREHRRRSESPDQGEG